MKYARELLIVVLVAAVLRFGPLLLYGVPVSYDAPFHLTRAQEVIETGFVNRGEAYPPFYRLLLAGLQVASGLDLVALGSWVLPLFSVLTALSVFVFVRRLAGPRMALLAALLVALGSPLIAGAYDSPKNILFFLVPTCLLLYRQGNRRLAAFLMASAVAWNQLGALVLFLPFVWAHYKDRALIKSFAASVAAWLALYFSSVDWRQVVGQSASAGMAFISFNLRDAMPSIAFACIAFAVPLLYACRAKRAVGGWVKYWFYWFSLSTVGIASFVFGTWLRPWEHVKFLYLSGAVLVPLVRGGNKFRAFVQVLLAFMLFSSVIMSYQLVYPKLQKFDFPALDFVARAPGGGKVLAEPSLSQWLSFKYGLGDRLLTSLHFEAAETRPGFDPGLRFLASQGGDAEAWKALKAAGLRFVVLNFEDARLRGTEGLEEKPFLNKVYSVEYFSGCPFPFLPPLWGLACGWNKAEVLEAGE